MMTGDNEKTARAVAEAVGVDAYYAEVLPEDKAAFVRAEHAAGRKVIMLGDGVNDSPALSEADAGVAISDGAAIAREVADITVSADDLYALLTLKCLSDALMERIHSNYRKIISFNFLLICLGVAGVLMTAGNSYAVCDVGFQLSFAAVVGTLAGGAVVRRSQEAWEKQRAKKKRPRLRFWKRKTLGLAGSLWETVCISACASMATFPVLVLRGMSTSLYALVSGAAVLWLVEPILLTGLGAALLGLVPALAPAQRVCSCCAEFLAEVLDRWALWVSGWPGAQIWFDTAYAAVVCLLLAGLCWLAFHNRVRLRAALPALLLAAGLAVFTGNALNRDVVRVELVGSRNAPAVVISRNESAVILFRGGDVTRCAVETTLERRNIRTVECLIDLRLRPRSAQRMGAEQRIAVDRMALYATRRVRCGPAEVEVLRTRNGCVARIHAAGQTFVTLSGSAALAAPVQADYLLASPARPDCVKYGAILSLSSDYRWMPEALSSGQLCHSFSRAE